jgi:hypothetical protein
VKQFKIANDNVLREHTGHNSDIPQRFPPFLFIGMRDEVGNTINPYLVILAAEIKFRRYLAADGPELPPVYDSLMRKTIEVADLLYFRPSIIEAPLKISILVDMKGFFASVKVNEVMDVRTTNNDESAVTTVRQKRQRTDTGGGTKRMDSNHWRHMLSGRGRFHIFIVGFLANWSIRW